MKLTKMQLKEMVKEEIQKLKEDENFSEQYNNLVKEFSKIKKLIVYTVSKSRTVKGAKYEILTDLIEFVKATRGKY